MSLSSESVIGNALRLGQSSAKGPPQNNEGIGPPLHRRQRRCSALKCSSMFDSSCLGGVAHRRSNAPACSTPCALLASRIGALGTPGYSAAGLSSCLLRNSSMAAAYKALKDALGDDGKV